LLTHAGKLVALRQERNPIVQFQARWSFIILADIFEARSDTTGETMPPVGQSNQNRAAALWERSL
jgi:hypothetical protein